MKIFFFNLSERNIRRYTPAKRKTTPRGSSGTNSLFIYDDTEGYKNMTIYGTGNINDNATNKPVNDKQHLERGRQ